MNACIVTLLAATTATGASLDADAQAVQRVYALLASQHQSGASANETNRMVVHELAPLVSARTAIVDAYLLLGASQREQHALVDAEHTYREGLVRAPTDVRLLMELATTLVWANRATGAQQLYDRVVGQRPNDIPARLARARTRMWSDDDDGAQEDLLSVLRLAPANTDALMGLGDLRRKQLRTAEALQLYEQARLLAPDDAELARAVNTAAQQTGEILRAEVRVAAMGSLALSPTTPGAGASFEFRYAANNRVTGAVGYEYASDAELLTLVAAVQRGTTATHTWRAQLTLRPVGGLTFDAGTQSQLSKDLVRHRLLTRVSAQFGAWSVLFGGQPGVHSDGTFDLGVDAGVQWSLAPWMWWMLQAFSYANTHQQATVSAVATVSADVTDRLTVRASVGGALVASVRLPATQLTVPPIATGAVSLTTRVTDRLELRASYQAMLGGLNRHVVGLESTLRF